MKHSFAPLSPDAVRYLSEHIGVDYSYGNFQPPNWLCVTGRTDEGELMGVAVFEFKAPHEAHFSLAVTDMRCISRRVMRAMFTAAFSQAVRLTALVDPVNRQAIRQMHLLGFVFEGYMRLGLDAHRDALVFGMLKEDCRYLNVPVRFPVTDHRHQSTADAESGSEFHSRQRRGSDLYDLSIAHLSERMTLTMTQGVVEEHVGAVLAEGRPADVGRVDAVPSAAGMRRDNLGENCGSVDQFTDDPMSASGSSLMADGGIALVVDGTFPQQAVRSFVGQGRSKSRVHNSEVYTGLEPAANMGGGQ